MSSENRRLCAGTFFAALSVLLCLPVALIYCWQYFWIFMANAPWWDALLDTLQKFPAFLDAIGFFVDEAPLMIMGLVVVPVSLFLNLLINLTVQIHVLKLPAKKASFLWFAVLWFAVWVFIFCGIPDTTFWTIFAEICMFVAAAGAGISCVVTLVRCVKRLHGAKEGAALENAA